MRIAVFRGEASVSELAARLYAVEDDGEPRRQRLLRAEAALVEANPQLENVDVLPSGATIRVPDVPGLSHTSESTPSADTAAAAGAMLAAPLAALQAIFDTAAQQRIDAANATIVEARSAAARAAARKEPALRGQLSQAIAQARAELVQAQRLRDFQAGLVQQMASDVQALGSRLASELGFPPFG